MPTMFLALVFKIIPFAVAGGLGYFAYRVLSEPGAGPDADAASPAGAGHQGEARGAVEADPEATRREPAGR